MLDVYLEKILTEIMEKLDGEEGWEAPKRPKGLPTMEARASALPSGISTQGIDYVHQHRPEMIKAVKHIVMDGIKEVHSNGDAKLWGQSVMDMLRISLAAKTTDPERECRILDWEASIGGK